MKVIHVVETYYPNVTGPARIIHELSKRLVKKGIECEVVTTDHKAEKSKRKQILDGIKIRRFPVKYKFMQYLVAPEIKKYLRNVECDVIHCHNYRGYHSQISYKIAKKRGIPFILTPHGGLLGYDHYLDGLNKLPYLLFDAITRKKAALDADRIIVLSKEEQADAIRYGLSKKRVQRIPVGINIQNRKIKTKKNRKLKVLFVGRITRNRNIEPIIRAAAYIKNKQKNLDVKFYIVGDEVKTSSTSKSGYMKELKEIVRYLEVSKIVEFVGPKYGKELSEYYRNSDIFVYLSKSENFGMPILEAAAGGNAIICSLVGLVPELITNGKNGFIIKNGPKEIAKRIVELKDPEKRERFRKFTMKILELKFKWPVIIKKYVSLYKSVKHEQKIKCLLDQ